MINRKKIGLIAGQGRLPFMIADGARAAGFEVICVGFKDQADPALAEHVDHFYWVPLARMGRWITKLRYHGITETIMVGRVAKRRMYTPWRIVQYLPDWRAFRVWYGRLRHMDKRNDSLLTAIADELASGGIILDDSTRYCQEHLARSGVMTRTQPPKQTWADIEFGWKIVKQMGELDIGQAIAVKEREVIAVEAIEGTDRMIERAGGLCKVGGWTLIKTAKPAQDMRFDVPTIGPGTIENLKKNHASCLVVEPERTIIIDMPETLKLADRLKIAVVGYVQPTT
ncbi:MAG: UDP-2,3-diacylglucosamine diphosphatase LpxI [Phycisphaerae bacterium]|nr:UDP-2,3-diacylglucosamine diphosphatase LpxI [Phycisphaerae bacterium]